MTTLPPGVDICTQEQMCLDQETWDDSDPHKHTNFMEYRFWVCTDCGADPVGFDSAKEALTFTGA